MQPRTSYVCIAGPQEAGKNYLACILRDAMQRIAGNNVRVDAIARPIYEIARTLTGDPDFQWDDGTAQRRAKARTYRIFGESVVKASETKNTPEAIMRGEMHLVAEHPTEGTMTGRELLQDIGRAFRKLYSREGFWIEQLVARNDGNCDIVLVCDCRMPSEAWASQCLVWIETEEQRPQQNAADETEQHLAKLRQSASFHVTRSGGKYSVQESLFRHFHDDGRCDMAHEALARAIMNRLALREIISWKRSKP